VRRDDGLQLIDSYITATARCAPPDNKPLPSEILNCRGYMEREIRILEPKAVLALGRIAWDAYLELLKQTGLITSRTLYRFAHGAEIQLPPPAPRLFGVYHPSQQNTQTGRVTPSMYAEVLRRIRKFLSD
jgi:uracil-DNA glycosylase family 4